MPRASIIVATYNGSRFVHQAIRSALDQSERDIEVIAVDDGSTDDTVELLEQLSGGDARLRVFRQPHAGRPAVGRNRGLAEARGDYVCFLDQDDLYHPDKLRQSVALLDGRPDADVVFHDVKRIDAEGRELPGTHLGDQRFMERAGDLLEPCGTDCFVCGPRLYHFMSLHYSAMATTSVLLRRSFLVERGLRFSEDLAVADDAAMWFDLARQGRVLVLDRVLSYYRLHGANTSLNQERMLSDVVRLHRRNYRTAQASFSAGELSAYRRKLARIHFDLGYCYDVANRRGDARAMYREGLAWRVSGRTLLAYAKTFVPRALVRLLRER